MADSGPLDIQPPREYVGLGLRAWAFLIDAALLAAVTLPLCGALFGRAYFRSPNVFDGPLDVLINVVAPALLLLIFWRFFSATPGKMIIHARIADARTGADASFGQLLRRLLVWPVGIALAAIGWLWPLWHPRAQTWHDLAAGTVVVRPAHRGIPAFFDGGSEPPR